jgi:Zn-dependent peptidase ImmA (M78 family)
MPGSAIAAGYREARNKRRFLGLSETQPVDPSWAAEELGLLVVRRPFDARRVSGLHLYRKDIDLALIVVNDSDTMARQRFTIAHEVAHTIFDRHETIIDELNGIPAGNSLKEIRANCFAGEFLMPRAAIDVWRPKRAWKDSPEDVAELAITFGTSFEAALYRLKSADILNDEDLAQLKRRYSDLDWPTRAKFAERGDESVVLPSRFLSLAEAALRKGIISRGKFEELMRGDLVT